DPKPEQDRRMQSPSTSTQPGALVTIRPPGSVAPVAAPVSVIPPPTVPSPTPVVEVSDVMDPLSHLSHIFEKIRKQVIEWGEDANWKIDVFLLPNEDGTTPSGAPVPPQSMSGPPLRPYGVSSIPPSGSAKGPRLDMGSPRRPGQGTQDIEMGQGTRSPRFILQPPPNDLPITGEIIPSSLQEKDIGNMSESEAKRMEREAEARLDVERQNIERDAFILHKKWKDASFLLKEKELEVRYMCMFTSFRCYTGRFFHGTE
ncbi:hypothetical protein BGZ65_009954, partial [Modicella reniformis]